MQSKSLLDTKTGLNLIGVETISMTYDSLKSLVDELVTKVENQGNGTKMLDCKFVEILN